MLADSLESSWWVKLLRHCCLGVLRRNSTEDVVQHGIARAARAELATPNSQTQCLLVPQLTVVVVQDPLPPRGSKLLHCKLRPNLMLLLKPCSWRLWASRTRCGLRCLPPSCSARPPALRSRC